jgi:phosphoesterase RecJ-like protein
MKKQKIGVRKRHMTRTTKYPDRSVIAAIRRKIEDSHRILVVSHIRPDGDAVGSLLGLGLALVAAGKDVQMVLQDGVPHNFKHLSGSDTVKRKPEGAVDLIIVVDVSDLPRLGKALDGYGIPDINIDHHFTNEAFAQLNLIESQASATAEVLARHLTEFGLSINEHVANALLTGLITDTIGFRIKTVTPATLRLVAELMEAGGNLSAMYYPALVQRTIDGARYWGAGLSKLQFQHRLVWTYLSLDDRKRAGYTESDDADLINILSAIEGVDVAMIMVEQSPSRVKISWRSVGVSTQNVDVSEIASKFGGGGHKAAAGAEVDGTLGEVLTRVVAITQEYLI